MIQAHVRRQEKSTINKLTLHLEELGKDEQTKLKVSRRKETIKTETETKKKKKNRKEQ